MMMTFYKLDENRAPVECGVMEYGEMWKSENFDAMRKVGLDIIGDYKVSTVFLGTDHGFGDYDVPILFETMIFTSDACNELDGYQERYATWEEAEAGHEKAVALVKEAQS